MGEEKLKEKEMSTEIQTDFEKPEYSKFGEFCQKHGINSNLIMLKITLFVMYGGKVNNIFIICSKFRETWINLIAQDPFGSFLFSYLHSRNLKE